MLILNFWAGCPDVFRNKAFGIVPASLSKLFSGGNHLSETRKNCQISVFFSRKLIFQFIDSFLVFFISDQQEEVQLALAK